MLARDNTESSWGAPQPTVIGARCLSSKRLVLATVPMAARTSAPDARLVQTSAHVCHSVNGTEGSIGSVRIGAAGELYEVWNYVPSVWPKHAENRNCLLPARATHDCSHKGVRSAGGVGLVSQCSH